MIFLPCLGSISEKKAELISWEKHSFSECLSSRECITQSSTDIFISVEIRTKILFNQDAFYRAQLNQILSVESPFLTWCGWCFCLEGLAIPVGISDFWQSSELPQGRDEQGWGGGVRGIFREIPFRGVLGGRRQNISSQLVKILCILQFILVPFSFFFLVSKIWLESHNMGLGIAEKSKQDLGKNPY